MPTRSQLIRKAASLPVGDSERKDILAGLKVSVTRGSSFHQFEVIGHALRDFEKQYLRDRDIEDPRGVAKAIEKVQGDLYKVGLHDRW